MFYALLRRLLFCLSPEVAHDLALRYLIYRGPSFHPLTPGPNAVNLMGLEFPNRIGMAAGFDKNGCAVWGLGSLSFGFFEIGTVTPKPQTGNLLPRVFRLPESNALINRMGMPNDGVDQLVKRLSLLDKKPLLGVNIGKNASTDNNDAVDDYTHCLQEVYPYADYVTINISSPNTKDLRELQFEHYLYDLLTTLKNIQSLLSHQHKRYVPLLVKVAPDLDIPAIDEMSKVFIATEVDGIVATNTTLSRDGLKPGASSHEQGGLSGKPLQSASNKVIQAFRERLSGMPIIGVGGVMSIRSEERRVGRWWGMRA